MDSSSSIEKDSVSATSEDLNVGDEVTVTYTVDDKGQKTIVDLSASSQE